MGAATCHPRARMGSGSRGNSRLRMTALRGVAVPRRVMRMKIITMIAIMRAGVAMLHHRITTTMKMIMKINPLIRAVAVMKMKTTTVTILRKGVAAARDRAAGSVTREGIQKLPAVVGETVVN